MTIGICQTVGCGHSDHAHESNTGKCSRLLSPTRRCSCAYYTSLTERVEGKVWVTDCLDCNGTGVFQLPEGTDTCVPCKGTGRAEIAIAAQTVTDPAVDLEALREVVAEGTPGPWEVDRFFWKVGSTRGEPDRFWVSVETHGEVEGTICQSPEDEQATADAALIVAAVNALPVLLDALEEYRQHNLTAMHEYRVQVRRAERAEKSVRELTAEVARLTAVVQGVREGIEAWATRLHGIRWEGESVSDQLRTLAGGTDTPKGEGE